MTALRSPAVKTGGADDDAKLSAVVLEYRLSETVGEGVVEKV